MGGALLVLGALVVALSLAGVLGGDDRTEVEVGKLVASDVPAATTAGTSAVSPTTAGSTEAPSGSPTWPAAVQGRPAAFGDQGAPPPADGGGVDDGVYLWSDFKGWHIWIAGGEPDTSVSIQADADLTAVAVGGATVDARGGELTVTCGDAPDRLAGADVNVGLYTTHLTVTVDGGLPLRTGAAASPATSPLDLRYEPGG